MVRPIGYYVHHHGDGHRQRAIAIARSSAWPITLLGTGLADRSGGIPCVDLPDDRIGDGFSGEDGCSRPSALHYAPLDHDGQRRRVAAITRWIAEARPALMVVDVSVEVAMLSRLASVPTVYVRLGGLRTDHPHREAFAGASALLAPFPAVLDDPGMPDDIRARTFYAPGIVPGQPSGAAQTNDVLVVVGRGGAAGDGERWAAAARSSPNLGWRVIGPCTVPADPPGNLSLLGWVEGAESHIASAGVVVGAAGDGLVNAVIAARKPFICLPEPRPFAEQYSKAERLGALGAAIVCREAPQADAWPSLVAAARRLDPTVHASLDIRDGARLAAQWLAKVADGGSMSQRRSA